MPEPGGAREEQLFTLKPLHVLLVGAGVLGSGEFFWARVSVLLVRWPQLSVDLPHLLLLLLHCCRHPADGHPLLPPGRQRVSAANDSS
jgi:hypothetical protein